MAQIYDQAVGLLKFHSNEDLADALNSTIISYGRGSYLK